MYEDATVQQAETIRNKYDTVYGYRRAAAWGIIIGSGMYLFLGAALLGFVVVIASATAWVLFALATQSIRSEWARFVTVHPQYAEHGREVQQ